MWEGPEGMNRSTKPRLAIVVSHPIQYYVPLYRLLAGREDVETRVFYTWHGGGKPVLDRGFKKAFAWDIPLTDGYQYEVVPNVASDPGTHHFGGLRNPTLTERVLAWRPDAIHLTGYAYDSHLKAMRDFHRVGVPLFFRGDSHLLDGSEGWRWQLKRMLLTRIYKWPSAFLYVGQANREYYKAFGVPVTKLHFCPHSIEVSRFAEPNDILESEAREWRRTLNIGEHQRVLLFAGKFEEKKQPLALMKAFLELRMNDLILILLGEGKLASQVNELARQAPGRFRVLPFQNQSRMPVVYRLGDLLVLPSAYGETWGLAVNEALACGRPVLVSDRVGCAADVVISGETGEIFPVGDWGDFVRRLRSCLTLTDPVHRQILTRFAHRFDIAETERYLMKAFANILDAERR